MHIKKSFLFLLILSLTFFACSNKEDNEPARKMLDEALSLKQAGKDDKANIILDDIIRKYPKTQIAIELNKTKLAGKEKTSSPGISAEETVKVNQATIRGEIITVGQSADIVQSRIKADKFVASGYNYGDTSKGYYNDGGSSYIITFGPPQSGSGTYVIRQIEKISK